MAHMESYDNLRTIFDQPGAALASLGISNLLPRPYSYPPGSADPTSETRAQADLH
jgi:hypothetical protein